MNLETPRVFIAATRQNDGKTTASLGLLSALQNVYKRIGYIKPVGQRFVEIEEQKIDEDTVLMDRVYQLNCPLVDMSPIAVEPDFTRKYLQASNRDALVIGTEGDGSPSNSTTTSWWRCPGATASASPRRARCCLRWNAR